MTKVTFLLNLRSPATLVSRGNEIRMGRPGASGSKNAANLNTCVGRLTTGGFKGPQLGRSNTQRTTNQVGLPLSSGLGCPTDGKVSPRGPAGNAAWINIARLLRASLTLSSATLTSAIRLESARLY